MPGDQHFPGKGPEIHRPSSKDSTDGEGWLFRFFQDKGDNPRLENIEDPDEYDFAAAVFENLMNNVHFEENRTEN